MKNIRTWILVVVVIIIGVFAVFLWNQFGSQKLKLAEVTENSWYPYSVESWDTPFNMESSRSEIEYIPLAKASKKWNICVSFPHMKDSYWLAVDYGVIFEAKRLGVAVNLYEAGGYDNLETQITQIRDCVINGADGVVIGAISYEGMNDLVGEIRDQGIPVIDVINGMSSDRLSAKSLVSFGEMGSKIGEYIAKDHPTGSKKVKVAWFPGPEGAGWVMAGDKGFKEAIVNSSIEIVATRYGDTGKAKQTELIEEVLDKFSDIDYVVGTAVTAEAAIDVLRERGLDEQIKIAAYYFTPPVYRGIQRGTIIAAPTDSAVIQGRISMDQVVRILEEYDYSKHVGPKLFIIDKSNVNTFDRNASLAPDGFRATYTVN